LDVQVVVESKDDASSSTLRVCLQNLSEDTSIDLQQVFIDNNSDERAGTFLTQVNNGSKV